MAKVWQELWDAMDATPAEWIATTEGMYFAMMESVPPQDYIATAFLVGEPTRHNAKGQAVYACFKPVFGSDEYCARYMTQSEFNEAFK